MRLQSKEDIEFLEKANKVKIERDRYREALEKIANAEEVGYPGSRMTIIEAQSIAMGALTGA